MATVSKETRKNICPFNDCCNDNLVPGARRITCYPCSPSPLAHWLATALSCDMPPDQPKGKSVLTWLPRLRWRQVQAVGSTFYEKDSSRAFGLLLPELRDEPLHLVLERLTIVLLSFRADMATGGQHMVMLAHFLQRRGLRCRTPPPPPRSSRPGFSPASTCPRTQGTYCGYLGAPS